MKHKNMARERDETTRSSSDRLYEGRPTDHYSPLSVLPCGVSWTAERKINGMKKLHLKEILPAVERGEVGPNRIRADVYLTVNL